MTVWKPEYVVTEGLARSLIEKQFPTLSPVSLYALGEGFDNTVYCVNKQFVFRFPRREIAVRLLQTEGSILPSLVPILPLPIPEPIYFGEANSDYPWSFIGYKAVKGKTVMHLTPLQRKGMTKPLAVFLRKLHSFPVSKAKKLGVPYDELDRLHIAKRKPILEEQVNQIMDLQLYDNRQVLREYILELRSCENISQETLVHGDLHIRNIVADEEGSLAGVIDWGDVHIGNRAVDLAAVYSLLLPGDRQHFYEIYGEVETQEKELARFRAVFINTVLLLYGYDKKDTALVKLAQESLQLALAEAV